MDAIHIMLGQNGRPSRTDTAPQTAATDLGAAFSRALAALEGGAPKETAGETEPPPEDDGAAIEEATTGSEANADGEALAEGMPLKDPENAAPVIAEPKEEEFLPLALRQAAASAVPTDDVEDGQVPPPTTKTQTGPPPLHASLPAETAPQGPQARLSQQQETAIVTGAPAGETAGTPASPAQSAAPVQSAIPLPPMPREGVPILARGAAAISTASDAEPSFDPVVIPSEDEVAEVRVMPKAAGVERHIPQPSPAVAFEASAKKPVEAKTDDGGMRLQADTIGMVQVENAASQSRSTPTAMFAPTAEARPVLNSIAEATVKAQNGTIELRLSPEELGRVRISMSHHDQGISVVLNVEREDTLHLLRRHASELATALREAGLGEATIEFANREQRSSPDPERRPPGQAFGTFSDASAEIDRPILRASGDGGLDIRM